MISKLSLLTTVLLIVGRFMDTLGTAVMFTSDELNHLNQNESLENGTMIPLIKENMDNISKVIEYYEKSMDILINNVQFFRGKCGENYDAQAWKSHVDALTFVKAHVLVTLHSLDLVLGTDAKSPWKDFRSTVVQDFVSCRLSAAVILVEVLSSLSDGFSDLKASLKDGGSVPKIEAAIRKSHKALDMAIILHGIAALEARLTQAHMVLTILPQQYHIWLLVNRMKLESLSASLRKCLLELETKTTKSKDVEAEYDSDTYAPLMTKIKCWIWLTENALGMTREYRLGKSDPEISNKFKPLLLDPQVKLPDPLPLIKRVCLKDPSLAIYEVCCAFLDQFIFEFDGTLDCDTKRAQLSQIILRFDGCVNGHFENRYLPLLQNLSNRVRRKPDEQKQQKGKSTKETKAQKQDGTWRLNVWHGMAAVCVVVMVGLGVYCLFFL